MPHKNLIYNALLRGINVSGHNMITMTDLKRVFTDLGFSNIKTYLQSGNVVFNCGFLPAAGFRTIIENEILNRKGLTVQVIVLQKTELQSIINNCPFTSEKYEKTAVYITFPNEKINVESARQIIFPALADEEFRITENAVYLYLPTGYGRTKLNNNFFEKKLKITSTTRNWKTVNELLILTSQTEN